MQTVLRQFSVASAFALLVFLLIGNAILTSRRVGIQIADQEWAGHSRQVLFELEQTEALLLDAETGQRGFLLTGDPKYLAPYNHAVTQIDGHIKALSRLTGDNPVQQAKITQLGGLAHQKLDELNTTIVLARTGRPGNAKAVVLSDHGLVVMNGIRQVIADTQKEEFRLESLRNAAYQRSIRITRISIVLAAIVGILGLLVLAYFIFRERALRERYTQEIRAREQWFRVTLTSIGDAVIATDRNGLVTFVNPVAEALTGISSSQAAGKDIRKVFPIFNELSGQVAENPVNKVMQSGRVIGLANHTALKRADGVLIPIEDSAAPIRDDRQQLIGVVLVFRDVSADRKSQDLLRRTEKLAAAARLSATVAHEINNPLEAVVNLIYIAKSDPAAPPAVVQHLAAAEQEIERVAHITRQTLGFYRESHAAEQIQVDVLIESILRMYSNKLSAGGIRAECSFSQCPPVLGVAGELRQVFSNVIANAVDAAGPNGTIAITSSFVPNERHSSVEVVIADSGTGVAPEHLNHIFEPFFTTKRDVGTGLGLWVTKEIIERHGGSIHVCASNGKQDVPGAAFTLRLPCAPTAEAGASANTSAL